MKTFSLILLLCSAILRAAGQMPGVPESPNACHAGFLESTDVVNPLIIHFQDQSSGGITLWQWNFGDGSTSTIQNPVHIYPAGGTYFVCLTVSSTDTGNICHDVLCVSTTIHEPGTCVADYSYTFDPDDRLKTHFADKSSGNINRWHWDFGDGNFSDDRNPVHVFPSYGNFRVCLTAYNFDSVAKCNDVKCDSLRIMEATECHAMFTSELDSLNPVSNTFRFNNISTGDPNKFIWKFDDGSAYFTPFVEHHFLTPGTHQACLVIKKEDHGEILCADSICKTIPMATYFDVGGHVFIGAFPINNPVSTGDTGVAYLFRIDGSRLILYNTSRFTHLGYYAFPKMVNGSYLIRAMLTPGSAHYAQYFPGYLQQSLSWRDAGILHLSDSNAYQADIHLIPANDSLAGPGVIHGNVVIKNAKDKFDMVPFAEVILFDGQMKPVVFDISRQSGQFELRNLPCGTYYASVEYPGKYSRLTAIWLDSVSPVIDSLRLEIFNHDVTAVHGLTGAVVVAGDLFPNPATNLVSLNIELANPATLKFEIRTLTGQVAWSGMSACKAGSNLITIPLGSARAGLYLFIISSKDGSPVAVKKLLKY